MTAVPLRATESPLRTIVFSTYYDATATSKEQDYGSFTAVLQEDFYFSSTLRMIALGRLRREASNNPYLAGLVEKYPEAVGYAILRSRSSDRAYNAKKERWWNRLCRRFTSAGDSLRILEAIIKIEMLLAGEIFLVERLDGTVQVIPSEFCGSPTAAPIVPAAAGGREINGIIYDAAGVVVAYRFGKMSSGGVLAYAETEVVPAAFVIHIFHKKRVHQGRGLPWLLASLRTARDLYEITRSKTKQIKDANAISGFIEKQNAARTLQGLAAPEIGADGAPVPEKSSDPADPVKTTPGPTVVELRPGTFIALEPGEKIHSLMSSYNASDYKELIMLMLHAMSTPVGLPVELWFSGLGDVNYSGYKGLGVQWNGRRQDVIEFLISAFYNPLYHWRVGKAVNEADLPPNPDPAEQEEDIEWVFRRTPILDDEKAGRANKLKLESGETDLAEVWAENGYTEEEVFARRRQLWIHLQKAAGKLPDSVSVDTVQVPEVFLLRGLLPGELPVSVGRGADPAVDPLTDPVTSAEGDAPSAADAAKDAAESATAAHAALERIEALVARLQPAA